jgi:hypothetical protein
MNPLNETDEARQQARFWSERLGTLAAAFPAVRPGAAFDQLDTASGSVLPTRLLSVLDDLRQRHQRREHAADKLRANEFMTTP